MPRTSEVRCRGPLDSFPYGGLGVDTKTNYGGEKRKYTGTEYDALSGLH
jgi:hypothetical protein